MWAARPHLGSIFEKLLHRKTFICLRLVFCTLFKTKASGKKGFHPCFCLPACCNCPVALSEFTTLILMIRLCLNWTVSKHAIAAGKTGCKIRFASQMWAARPHLGSIFEKLLHRKTFICLRLVFCTLFKTKSVR